MKESKKQILNGIVGIEKSRMIANNTIEYYKANERYIRLHQTDIIIYKANGDIILNNGGWFTSTTKDRLNFYLPVGYSIKQKNNQWYLNTPNGKSIDYYNGMIIRKNKPKKENKKSKNHIVKYEKLLTKYIKKLNDLDVIPTPNSGDCWMCSMFEREFKDTDTEHLLQHLREGYIHGSVLINALKSAGYNDTGISWICQKSKEKDNRDSLIRAVRKYYRKAIKCCL